MTVAYKGLLQQSLVPAEFSSSCHLQSTYWKKIQWLYCCLKEVEIC